MTGEMSDSLLHSGTAGPLTDTLRVAVSAVGDEGVVGVALHGQHHGAARLLDGGPHGVVVVVVAAVGAVAARVVLDVVDAPGSPVARVLHLVVARRSEARASVRPLRSVQSALQADGVDVRRHRLEQSPHACTLTR